MSTENWSKPGLARHQVVWVPGSGFVVVDPDGQRVGAPSDTRPQAERLRDEAQRAADAKAKRGPRACLCCGRVFESEGIHNRMCGPCRNRDTGDVPARLSGTRLRRAVGKG
ncbi:hypothetical protein RNZ50_15820 [Paracoccaceae bacterium Fryx2]|nr:hypothetical protein [Paracoccaceae bacterium Fryx2]